MVVEQEIFNKMKKIKFETSFGTFECDVVNEKEVKIKEDDYWNLKRHLDFSKVFIHDDKWIKIRLIDEFYGDPEYKYEVIE